MLTRFASIATETVNDICAVHGKKGGSSRSVMVAHFGSDDSELDDQSPSEQLKKSTIGDCKSSSLMSRSNSVPRHRRWMEEI
ncbi:unnamed protein product [Haemonchus placei]|uniref:Uncharacterized protein n=1 Tax=Haemonchus placei TaxID=6290 RepID=A0A0N4WY83_HAEPC|nr:unnamed protein product [Haemonchus placei]